MDTLKPTQNLQPFRHFCMSIGSLPTSYLESISYAELLFWFSDYLKNTVIPTINNNSDCVKELQALYIHLKSYADNYFNNLDVQEQINNKLDIMANDGTLSNLLSNFLNLQKTYPNLSSMLNDNFLISRYGLQNFRLLYL